MSSTRNTKRKRSKAAVAPATSSTRERAADSDPAHTTTGDSTAEVDKKTTPDNAPSTTSITTASAGLGNGSEKGESSTEDKASDLGSSNQSTEQGGMKKEADAAEPISETTGNKKSAETDNMTTKDQTQDKASGSTLISNDASSSSTSSQDGASTRRQALHIANDDEDREKRIRDLISHRSVLLDRVKACKATAESRVGRKSEGTNNNPINTDDVSDDQEIAAFRSMTRAANQAARKSRELEASAEKRTSLSLRRGSSVGKRMNAALSSLVPGSNLSGTGGAANSSSAGNSTTATAGHPNSAESNLEAKGASPFSKYSTTKSSNDPSATTLQASGNSIKSNKSTSPFPSQATKQYEALSRGRAPNNKNTKSPKTGGVQAGIGVSHTLVSSQNLKKNVSLPMGARPAGSNPLSKQGPKVNFPEAIALREKREQIELKLQNLMERKQNNLSLKSSNIAGSGKTITSSSYEDELTRRKASPGGVGIAKAMPNKKVLHPAMNGNARGTSGLEILPPAHLPNRRKTHWDVVLQEMAWLASDFMEERKWKMSTCRLISSTIPVHGLSDRRKRTSDANRGVVDNVPRDLPADASNSISDGSADETPGSGEDETAKKKDVLRKYSVPMPADEEIAKCRSQIVSCMISKLQSAITKGGLLESSDRHHQEALESFASSRSDILRSTSDLAMKDFHVKNDSMEGVEVDVSSDDMSEDKSTSDESSFDNVDDYINHFHNVCNSKHKLAAKETSKALKNGKIKLSGKQKEMLEFVDKLWSAKPHAGAVISGSPISGITFGTATIIWKQRTQGSQILICPSRSMIRWKYELSRFSNIRVLTFGSSGGISNPYGDNDVAKIGSTDVVLCEYGSVSRLKYALSKMSENPFSVTIDLRHFGSLRKSLSPSTVAGTEDFPLELSSNSWWGDLVTLVRKREIRCLLLEYYDSDPLSLSDSGLEQKEQIGILAKRAACVTGPEVFGSGSHSIEREVVTWARRKGKNDIVDKALRVRKILGDTLKPMSFHVSKQIVSSFDFNWELRSCKMTADQRQEYERCCNEVRGALSSTIEFSNSNRYHYSIPVVSNALFRLRQECFYSQKHAVQSYSASGQKPLNGSSVSDDANSNFWGNSSQPDVIKATSILESSSKLKELVSILSSECGYALKMDETTKKLFGIQKNGKKGKDQKRPVKKIVIFAALPHIQKVISTLLNSLGIQNELLGHGEMKIPKLDKQPGKLESIAWTKSQTVLSRFCSDDDIRKTNIIIASPSVLSGRSDGIGIEGADIIITLDSDWSGRDGFILNHLVRRWHAKNKLAGKEDKLIRLVSANSIEARIFDNNEGNLDDLSWPLDVDGFFTLPLLQEETSTMYKTVNENDLPSYSFPAVGIMKHRGSLLEEVLSAKHLPSLFGSGTPSVFLPQLPNASSFDEETFAEIHFLRHFLHNEKTGSVSTKSPVLTEPSIKYHTSCAGLISRNDIPVIESRLFLENLIHSHSLSRNADDHPLADGLQSNVLLRSNAQAAGESSSPKIDENPSSLLFYEPNHDLSSSASQPKNNQIELQRKANRRYNAYAKLFSSSWNGIALRDGNQGCEPLVFFPPLFPLLEEASKKARIQYNASSEVSGEGDVKAPGKSEFSSQKRKDRDVPSTLHDGEHDAKRLKTQSASKHVTNGCSAPNSLTGMDTVKASSQPPLDSTDRSSTQTGLAQVDSTSSSEGPKWRTPRTSGAIMFHEDFGLLGSGAFPSHLDATSFSARASKVNDSYRPDDGLNAYACDAEETSSSSLQYMVEGMESVLLFVKKRHRSTQPPYKHILGLSNRLPLPAGGKPAGDDSNKKTKKKGAQGNLQMPATAFTRLPSNAATQLSQVLPRTSMANSRQVKGDFRHKLLASFYTRQRFSGLTLFDSVPYRAAAMRVEKRVMERVEKLMWKTTLALDAGPGLPVEFVEKSLSQFVDKSLSINRAHSNSQLGLDSIVMELKDGLTTGGVLGTKPSVQKKSPVSPRCVDFGAFEVGYLSSPSGMIGTPTTRRRVGVSLPMGVRLMKPTKDQEKSSVWNDRDDKILEATVKKFGINWLLVASATSGFEHAVIRSGLSGIENITPSVAKSARQCRDRWQLLTQGRPSLSEAVHRRLSSSDTINNLQLTGPEQKVLVYSAENVNIICKSDDFFKPPDTKDLTSTKDANDADSSNTNDEGIATGKEAEAASPRSTADKKDNAEISEPVSMQVEKTSPSVIVDVQMPEPSKTTKPKRRSFSAISIARSRRQVFPVTIPGVDVNTNQPGHPVPSHPSHMQSVQLSVAAQWASGRTEMWPLQILDLADKQRSNAARINIQRGEIPTGHNSSRRHPPSSSSYQHRPHSSQASAGRAPVGYSSGINAASRPVAPRPAGSSVSPHHQHRSPTVAAATVQAYMPPQNSAAGMSKKNDVPKPSKSSPKRT